MEISMDKILVTRSSMPPKEEYFQEIASIWDNHWLTNMGEKHEKLREELRQYLKVQNMELFTNGHMALELTLQALDLEGEVITTPYTFASTTHAIVRNGLIPVFCDINPQDYTIDVEKLEGLITDRTCAIVPVHVYGNLCDVKAIGEIAERHGLKVVYDAAHAFGETFEGAGVGSFGDASMFSFHATKVYNTIEGGGVCFGDESLGRKLYRLKNFGIMDEETVDWVGANAKMNEFQAAMGLCNLRHVDAEIEKRRAVSERYRENLEGVSGIRLSRLQPGVKYNYAYFPVVFEAGFGATRDEVYNALAAENIYARKYFYPITSTFECYRNGVGNATFDASSTPVALDVSMRVLTLPMFADLPLEAVDRICGVIRGLAR